MISEKTVKKFCREDLSLIENYDIAVKSNETYDCHHRLETELNKSVPELIEMDLYYNRPASELIFIPHDEHTKIHHTGKTMSKEACEKMSISRRGRIPWNKEKSWDEETKLKISNTLKGNIPWNKGKKGVSDETRLKMSIAAKNRKRRSA